MFGNIVTLGFSAFAGTPHIPTIGYSFGAPPPPVVVSHHGGDDPHEYVDRNLLRRKKQQNIAISMVKQFLKVYQ